MISCRARDLRQTLNFHGRQPLHLRYEIMKKVAPCTRQSITFRSETRRADVLEGF